MTDVYLETYISVSIRTMDPEKAAKANEVLSSVALGLGLDGIDVSIHISSYDPNEDDGE